MREVRTDVLIVGAGLAGLRAAREASFHGEVLMASLNVAGDETASLTPRPSQYELSRLLDVPVTSREREAYIEEAVAAGLGRANQELVRVMANQAQREYERLRDLGVTFEKTYEAPTRVRGCFSTRKRCYVMDDLRELSGILYQEIRPANVRLFGYTRITALHLDGGRFAGASALDREGNAFRIRARACILAAGGAAGIYRNTFVPRRLVGASTVLADGIGAQLNNLPFMQFMLGTLEKDLHPVRLRFYGQPQLVDASGADVMTSHFPTEQARESGYQQRFAHYPFTMHDGSGWLDVEVARASGRGGCRLKTVNDQTPISVYAHAGNGGVSIDVRGATNVPGLYACGEGATGMHGANRLGGQLLMSCLVFGTRAGHFAGLHAREAAPSEAPFDVEDPVREGGLGRGELDNYDGMIRDLVSDKLGVIRRSDDLRNAIGVAEMVERVLGERGCAMRKDANTFAQIRMMAAYAKKVFTACADLPESVGPHYLED